MKLKLSHVTLITMTALAAFHSPLLAKKLRAQSSFKVLIDPGHGGKFFGCTSVSQKLHEKDVALDIAQRVAKLLQEKKVQTSLTRTEDMHFSEELPEDLQHRVNLVKEKKPDIFISIHLNASDQKNRRGFELYVPHTANCPVESYLLATWLHHGMAQEMEANWIGTLGNLNGWDGGIRSAKFFVLRDHVCPAVLLELDYLTHATVDRNYQLPAHRQKTATIIADAIMRYIDYKITCVKS